jgi:hypothetical protein
LWGRAGSTVVGKERFEERKERKKCGEQSELKIALSRHVVNPLCLSSQRETILAVGR